MENSSSTSGERPEDQGPRKTILGASPRRIIIILGTVVVVVAATFYGIDVRNDHLERVERTHQLAATTIAQIESTFDSIDPLSASELSRLRTYRNKDHVSAAEFLGIEGLESVQEARFLSEQDGLVRIDDDSLYTIEDLDYSVPYLVPSGAALLDRIGERFQQRLREKGLPEYQFVITSVTRTREHQKALQQVNVNAAQESSHEYGTTFDVHYGKFGYGGHPSIPDSVDIYEDILTEELAERYAALSQEYTEKLKAVLGRVIIGLQDQGTAMAIYERRQPVFHVTVARDLTKSAATNESLALLGSGHRYSEAQSDVIEAN